MRPRPSLHLIAIALLATGLLAACGNDDDSADDDSTGAQQSDAESDATRDDGDSADDDTGDWSAIADAEIVFEGTSYGLGEIRRCEIPSSGPNLEVHETIHGLREQDGMLGLVFILQISESPAEEIHWVSWRGPEGLRETYVMGSGDDWLGDGQVEYDSPVINLDGDRATGAATLANPRSLDPDDSIDITFDVAIPDERTSC